VERQKFAAGAAFRFSPSAIIKRPPLSPTARRAGWVGCNFALNRIPADARIPIVTESTVLSASEVRERFKRVKPLKDIPITQRGWTLDVLNVVRRISEGRAPRDPNISGQSGTRDHDSRSDHPCLGNHLVAGLGSQTRPSGEFTTADAYAFTRELEKLHPDNRHVKDKIRQQLQVLRDLGLLQHVGRGVWRLP
jgi:type II restriction enzyme